MKPKELVVISTVRTLALQAWDVGSLLFAPGKPYFECRSPETLLHTLADLAMDSVEALIFLFSADKAADELWLWSDASLAAADRLAETEAEQEVHEPRSSSFAGVAGAGPAEDECPTPDGPGVGLPNLTHNDLIDAAHAVRVRGERCHESASKMMGARAACGWEVLAEKYFELADRLENAAAVQAGVAAHA